MKFDVKDKEGYCRAVAEAVGFKGDPMDIKALVKALSDTPSTPEFNATMGKINREYVE